MSKKWYGNLNNRIDENRMFCDKIEVGTPLTEYMWSDRHAYYVSNIIDDKTIEIKRYITKIIGGSAQYGDAEYEYIENPEASPIKIKFIRGKWHKISLRTKTDDNINNMYARIGLTDKQIERFERGETVVKTGEVMNISFGVANEYYDPCF